VRIDGGVTVTNATETRALSRVRRRTPSTPQSALTAILARFADRSAAHVLAVSTGDATGQASAERALRRARFDLACTVHEGDGKPTAADRAHARRLGELVALDPVALHALAKASPAGRERLLRGIARAVLDVEEHGIADALDQAECFSLHRQAELLEGRLDRAAMAGDDADPDEVRADLSLGVDKLRGVHRRLDELRERAKTKQPKPFDWTAPIEHVEDDDAQARSEEEACIPNEIESDDDNRRDEHARADAQGSAHERMHAPEQTIDPSPSAARPAARVVPYTPPRLPPDEGSRPRWDGIRARWVHPLTPAPRIAEGTTRAPTPQPSERPVWSGWEWIIRRDGDNGGGTP
jgi:hypothetical protein